MNRYADELFMNRMFIEFATIFRFVGGKSISKARPYFAIV